MCSVVGCESSGRSAQRFTLPEDPERRLEWVQFLLEVNGQRLKESSWTDITMCREHFKDDCFIGLFPSGTVQLKPSAVPSVFVRPEPNEPEERLDCEETVETSVTSQCDQKNMNVHLIREKAVPLQMKGKYVVNEKCPFQLFNCKCPSCGSKLQMKKKTCGTVLYLNLQCFQCEYRHQWKSQVDISVPTTEDQQEAGDTEAHAEAVLVNDSDVPEIIAVVDEENDHMDESEDSSDQGDGLIDNDDDWHPLNDTDQETESDKEDDDYSFGEYTHTHNQLCTECGKFYRKQWPHTCEHKVRPYSCNICGRRCVSEVALITHSRIHNANYEYRCKYCNLTFKTKVDKISHEQIHLSEGTPYQCPDCSQTFATNNERRIHLEHHRGPKQLKCDICGIEFVQAISLQRHLAVHTGEKPFKCSVCQRGFNQAGHLKSHMRLHTGERPYKCQHCDKSFNHNVSLKSHVERCHTSNSGCEQNKGKANRMTSDTDDARGSGNKKSADSEEQDTEEDMQEKTDRPKKKKRRSTGRPIGRPKSHASSDLALESQLEGSGLNMETEKTQRLQTTQRSDDGGEDVPLDSDTIALNSAEEDGQNRNKRVSKRSEKSKRKPKRFDSDSDFDPEDGARKKNGSNIRGKRTGKGRGKNEKKSCGVKTFTTV